MKQKRKYSYAETMTENQILMMIENQNREENQDENDDYPSTPSGIDRNARTITPRQAK